jgi:hypothetical protein
MPAFGFYMHVNPKNMHVKSGNMHHFLKIMHVKSKTMHHFSRSMHVILKNRHVNPKIMHVKPDLRHGKQGRRRLTRISLIDTDSDFAQATESIRENPCNSCPNLGDMPSPSLPWNGGERWGEEERN